MSSANRFLRPLPIGVDAASDRAARGVYEDLSGAAIEAYLAEVLATPFRIVKRLVEDEQAAIEAALIRTLRRRGLLAGRHHRRHRSGAARRDAGGARRRLRSDDAGLRRGDAGQA